MLRDHLSEQLDHDPHFRWRGEAVTRIENLSDIVFALALGMLVSAAQVPANLPQLEAHLLNIIPVILGFTLMLGVWNAHFTFFRRYGVADHRIIFLNAILLLVILYIAYPLRFIFDSLFAYMFGAMGDWSRMRALGIASYADAARITTWFALGYTVLYALVLAMYDHAMRKADLLGLNVSERLITQRSIWRHRTDVLLGLLVIVLANFTPAGPFAGFLFVLIWPVNSLIRRRLKLPGVILNEGEEQV